MNNAAKNIVFGTVLKYSGRKAPVTITKVDREFEFRGTLGVVCETKTGAEVRFVVGIGFDGNFSDWTRCGRSWKAVEVEILSEDVVTESDCVVAA